MEAALVSSSSSWVTHTQCDDMVSAVVQIIIYY